MLMLMTLCHTANGRNVVDNDMYISEDSLPTTYKLRLQRYMYREPYIFEGDTLKQYLLPELPVYAELVFKNKKQRQQYNKLVYNVKKVLPLAQEVNAINSDDVGTRHPSGHGSYSVFTGSDSVPTFHKVSSEGYSQSELPYSILGR